MNAVQCEYCSRPIKGNPETRVLQGHKHLFCSEFCFRLYFYDFPNMSYEDIQKMYLSHCVSVPTPNFKEILKKAEVSEND